MGCGQSTNNGPDKALNSNIERGLSKEKEKMKKEIKLLLLGAGESGKSTIFRQMKIIHQNGFNKEEFQMYRDVIYNNVVTSMKTLIAAANKFEIPLYPENNERAMRIASLEDKVLAQIGNHFHDGIAEDVRILWADEGIKQAFQRRNELQIIDSAEHFFNKLDKLSQPDYLPDEADVLRSRIKTTGLTEIMFNYGNLDFKMFDVGGQRNERRKWIHCFQNCTGIIFVTSLSEYDQKCYEDDTTNRMKESLLLFEEICNSSWFINTSIMLFFNKDDLFREKIAHTSLNVCFPDYQGGCNYDNAKEFITKKFVGLNLRKDKQIYTHFTCATDTGNIRHVFDCCRDIILQDALKGTGLLL